MAVPPLALPANLEKIPPTGGFGFSEDPGEELMSPDSKMGLEPPDPPVESRTAKPMPVESAAEIFPAAE